MRELIEKLERAEAGSRELDVAICCALHDGPEWAKEPYFPLRGGVGLYSNGKGGPGLTAPAYTTSLDAALALAERVLPGWLWEATTITTTIGGIRKPLAVVVDPEGENDDVRTFGTAATPALAFCIAILRALRTTEQHSPAQQKKED